MYDLFQQGSCAHSNHAADEYDGDYDEYLMWHSNSSYIMLRVDMSRDYGVRLFCECIAVLCSHFSHKVPLIPALEQRAQLQTPYFVSVSSLTPRKSEQLLTWYLDQ